MYHFHFMTLIFIITTVVGTQAEQDSTGVYFIHRNQVYTTYSSWLMTFTFDLDVYQTYLKDLEREILNFRLAHHDLSSLYNQGLSQRTDDKHVNETRAIRLDVINLIEQESTQFQTELEAIKTTFNNLLNLATRQPAHSKQKRNILFGALWSLLFGTSSNADSKQLKRTISTLADSESQVIHLVEESVSIINRTHTDVKENRQVINKLTNATKVLKGEVTDLYSRLSQVIEPEIIYIQLVSRLHDVSHIVSSALRATHSYLHDLSEQVLHSTHGTLSPFIVDPVQLENLLRNIRKSLPGETEIPYSLTAKGLIDYYRYLGTVLIPDKDRFHILCALPVVQENIQFDIYEAIPMPVPQVNVSLSAMYVLEGRFIAISKHEQSYAVLSDIEAIKCLNTPYCSLHSPEFDTDWAPNCLSALYKYSRPIVNKLCKRNLIPNTPTPTLQYLTNGKWVISISQDLEIMHTCNNKEQYRQSRTQPEHLTLGTHLITMKEGCGLKSKYFYIPPYVTGGTESQHYVKLPKPNNYNVPQIWPKELVPMLQQNKTANDTLSILSPIKDLPLMEMDQLLQKSKQMNKNVKNELAKKSLGTFHLILITVTVTIATVICFILALMVIKWKQTGRHFFPCHNATPAEKELDEPAPANQGDELI